MPERFQKLFSLNNIQYEETSPILLMAGNLLRDTVSGKIIIQLKFRNISSKTVSAVKVMITTYAVNGAVLEANYEYQYLDLQIPRGQDFGQKVPIYVPNLSTRSYRVRVNEVVFSDGEIWTTGDHKVFEILPQQVLKDFFKDQGLVKQYELENGVPCTFVPCEISDLWFCTCGAINHNNEKNCFKCGLELQSQISRLNIEQLKNAASIRLKNEQVKERKKGKIFALICLCIAVLGAVYFTVLHPNISDSAIQMEQRNPEKDEAYEKLLDAIENEDWMTVKIKYREVKGYRDADSYIESLDNSFYDIIIKSLEAGDLKTATDNFHRMMNDSSSIYISAEESIQQYKEKIISSLQGTWESKAGERYEIIGTSYKTTGGMFDDEGEIDFYAGVPGFSRLSTISHIKEDSFVVGRTAYYKQ